MSGSSAGVAGSSCCVYSSSLSSTRHAEPSCRCGTAPPDQLVGADRESPQFLDAQLHVLGRVHQDRLSRHPARAVVVLNASLDLADVLAEKIHVLSYLPGHQRDREGHLVRLQIARWHSTDHLPFAARERLQQHLPLLERHLRERPASGGLKRHGDRCRLQLLNDLDRQPRPSSPPIVQRYSPSVSRAAFSACGASIVTASTNRLSRSRYMRAMSACTGSSRPSASSFLAVWEEVIRGARAVAAVSHEPDHSFVLVVEGRTTMVMAVPEPPDLLARRQWPDLLRGGGLCGAVFDECLDDLQAQDRLELVASSAFRSSSRQRAVTRSSQSLQM